MTQYHPLNGVSVHIQRACIRDTCIRGRRIAFDLKSTFFISNYFLTMFTLRFEEEG